MGSDQHYSLRWNDYTVKIVTAFQHLRDEEDFVDVTVACDGHSYAAHKMVLSACSPYFRTLLRANPCQHPIVILKDVGHTEMERLLEFMYNGEVNIAQDQLGAFLKTAENLKIRGLAGSSDESDQNHTKDLSHSFSSTYGGGQSGRSSPSAGYAPSQGSKDDEIIQDGQGSHARPDSPPSKRRKRSNMAALGQTDVNTSSQSADGVTEESGQSDIVSAGQLGSEDDQRTDRREMKSEPGDSMTDIYSESSDLSIDPQQVPHGDGLDPRQSVMYPLAIPGPSGSAGATDTVPAGSHEPGGGGGDGGRNGGGSGGGGGIGWISEASGGGGCGDIGDMGGIWYPQVLVRAARPKTYLCPFCDKRFTNRQSRSRHVHQKHAAGLSGTCQVCGHVYTNLQTRCSHTRVQSRKIQ